MNFLVVVNTVSARGSDVWIYNWCY